VIVGVVFGTYDDLQGSSPAKAADPQHPALLKFMIISPLLLISPYSALYTGSKYDKCIGSGRFHIPSREAMSSPIVQPINSHGVATQLGICCRMQLPTSLVLASLAHPIISPDIRRACKAISFIRRAVCH
jgi:hypothetical protein